MESDFDVFELLSKYLKRFNEKFPLFVLMNVERKEAVSLIQKCLDDGAPLRPEYESEDV